ncbi:MAG: DJ-1/PfpI family protein [Planctomycetota bacterium]
MPKRVLLIVGDFVEDYEVMAPFQMLRMVGCEPVAVCPDKDASEFVATAIHDFEGYQTYTEKPGHRFQLNGSFADARESDFDALLLPGGRSPEYLRVDGRVLTLVKAFFAAGKPIAATCHAAMILAAADRLRGRRCQAYPACRPDVELAGGLWDEPSPALDSVCVDASHAATLITAPAWPANPAWVRALLDTLGVVISD